jgi:hypothetical protein
MPPPTLNAPGAWSAWAQNAATLQSYLGAPDPPGTLMFQVQKPGGSDKVNIPAANGPLFVRRGFTITGEWTIDPYDSSNIVPIVGSASPTGTMAPGTGASGGLWTHTPVDWRGNEGVAKPGGWPSDAAVAVPPAGSTSGATGQAPTISAISSSGITTTGATINYTLSPSSTNQVEYGTTLAYGSTNTEGVGAGPQVKPLTGLVSGTTYHYRIRATANGLTTYSADYTFTTS